jgi:hypothetical protein
LRPLPLVCIEWIDSASVHEWRGIEEIHDQLTRCVSIGWLLHDTNDVKTLLPTVQLSIDDARVINTTSAITIPHGAITAMHALTMPEAAQEIKVRG